MNCFSNDGCYIFAFLSEKHKSYVLVHFMLQYYFHCICIIAVACKTTIWLKLFRCSTKKFLFDSPSNWFYIRKIVIFNAWIILHTMIYLRNMVDFNIFCFITTFACFYAWSNVFAWVLCKNIMINVKKREYTNAS